MKLQKVQKAAWWLLYDHVGKNLPWWWRPGNRVRARMADKFARVHPTANIGSGVVLGPAVVIEEHGGVGADSVLSGEVRIGPHVTMGPMCFFTTGIHPVPGDGQNFRDMEAGHAPIVVEEDAFIGARVTVLPGVTIGRGAAVGAGSVVAKDVAPGATVVGNPAREIRRREV